MSTETRPKHIGRNISRIRELRGMKQEALAQAIGTNQQAISGIEQSETVDPAKLKEIAKALGVTVEAIENFSEESVFNYFNTFYDNSSNQGQVNGRPGIGLAQAFQVRAKTFAQRLGKHRGRFGLPKCGPAGDIGDHSSVTRVNAVFAERS